ncbi:hypothetical protein HPB49_007634 [Dermacentor silvarum]|uniref:Uncharacterized protein n=1 Tax=Dermacentor silvarum TaxID=543639 RepID=A0ACB8CW30_DERSI|nr:hypothetical protein HPB49_007634 [Dermacentor silvarum]
MRILGSFVATREPLTLTGSGSRSPRRRGFPASALGLTMVNEATTTVEPLRATSGGPEEERMDQTTEPNRSVKVPGTGLLRFSFISVKISLFFINFPPTPGWLGPPGLTNAAGCSSPRLTSGYASQGPGKPAAPPHGKSASPKLKKHPPLPRLPATDFKIVFRPGGGLNLRPINGGALLPILCAGAEIDYNQARSQDKLRINPHNSLTVSPPSEPRMKRYNQLQGLQLNDQQSPMKAYVAAPDNAIKGVLYNAVYNQSQEEIFEDLVHLNPSLTFTIADARELGRTKSILVTFIDTTEVPR